VKEPVRSARHPWTAGIVLVAIAAIYFVLLAKNRYPEPAPILSYKNDIQEYKDKDNVPTRFEETNPITPNLQEVQAMAIGPQDNLYVGGKDAVAVFNTNFEEIKKYPITGNPNSIGIGPNGTIFLGIRDHIEVLHSNGTEHTVWDDLGDRALITSIAVDEEDVIVADAGNRIVVRYNHKGEILGYIGEKDEEMDIPGIVVPSPFLDVAFNPEGRLWVVNPGRMGIESYRKNGSLITSWYNASMELDGFSGCCNPAQIAFTPDGLLVTGEKGLKRVKIYNIISEEYLELVVGSRHFTREQSVRDLAVDSKGRIFVLDPAENSVRIFEAKEQTYEQTARS
jgi:ligand-binding sensor domain-containing protein